MRSFVLTNQPSIRGAMALVAGAVGLALFPISPRSSTIAAPRTAAARKLEKELDELKIPPDWVKDVRPRWNVRRPWKEGRQEIRRLLGTGKESDRREGIRLTWDYYQKRDIGNGHEYALNMFLSGERLWAIHAYRWYLGKGSKDWPHVGISDLASLYIGYENYEEAEALLKRGLKIRVPKRGYAEMTYADIYDAMGDLYVAWGKNRSAVSSYNLAIRYYRQAKPPYGAHLMPRRAKGVQSKLDLLSIESLKTAKLKDGTYRATSLGYTGDIRLIVQVRQGRIANIQVQHQEKIDQNACVIVPKAIVDQQSLKVDAISGATVTQDAITVGTLRALKQAGL
ncbi:MAG: hypothetical protein CMJ78_04120 [Planctomycetaceae bacterium]|nr:hypothetical protein [Planctomycetaceae bacterium]